MPTIQQGYNRTTASIGQSAHLLAETRAEYNPVSTEEEFPEGQILTRLHLSKERSRQVVARKKRKVLQETGKLACEVCGFDFFRVYGQLGYEFAECHHTVPVPELGAGHRTRLVELAIVCANCHRMIHRSRPMLSVGGLGNWWKAGGGNSELRLIGLVCPGRSGVLRSRRDGCQFIEPY